MRSKTVTAIFSTLIAFSVLWNLNHLSVIPKGSPVLINLNNNSTMSVAAKYRSGYWPVAALRELGLKVELNNVEGLISGKYDWSRRLFSQSTINPNGPPIEIANELPLGTQGKSVRAKYKCRVQPSCDLTIHISDKPENIKSLYAFHDPISGRFYLVDEADLGGQQ
jgi:hypothetical protein